MHITWGNARLLGECEYDYPDLFDAPDYVTDLESWNDWRAMICGL